jgi:hypothetical protein
LPTASWRESGSRINNINDIIQVLQRCTLARARIYFCQVSADATGTLLLASYYSNVRHAQA